MNAPVPSTEVAAVTVNSAPTRLSFFLSDRNSSTEAEKVPPFSRQSHLQPMQRGARLVEHDPHRSIDDAQVNISIVIVIEPSRSKTGKREANSSKALLQGGVDKVY